MWAKCIQDTQIMLIAYGLTKRSSPVMNERIVIAVIHVYIDRLLNYGSPIWMGLFPQYLSSYRYILTICPISCFSALIFIFSLKLRMALRHNIVFKLIIDPLLTTLWKYLVDRFVNNCFGLLRQNSEIKCLSTTENKSIK